MPEFFTSRPILLKNMDPEDIEDGEILEDDSNSIDQSAPLLESIVPTADVAAERYEKKNINFVSYFKNVHIKSHHHHNERDLYKNSRRERAVFLNSSKKRRRIKKEDSLFRNEKYYSKKTKRLENTGEEEGEDDENVICILGGSLGDKEQKIMIEKPPALPDPLDVSLDVPSDMFIVGENEDPRPYSRRSPTGFPDKGKKERASIRGMSACLLKRRSARGAGVLRKEKLREKSNDVCSFFVQGKCHRGSECPFSHAYNQPRKLEVCKFYLNDCCTKRDRCIYMHSDFPCKYHHLPGLVCALGKNCKFSHTKLDEIQRAVLKKYADIAIKEIDEPQRFHNEGAIGSFNARSKEKKELNIRIPSLFDIRVAVPAQFRGTGDNANQKEREGDGVTTPVPSPHSMIYENNDEEASSLTTRQKNKNKASAEFSDHDSHECWHEESDIPAVQFSVDENKTTKCHKKKSKKSDDLESEKKNRKHAERKKKKSKKEDKNQDKERRKKKRERKRSKDDCEYGINDPTNLDEVQTRAVLENVSSEFRLDTQEVSDAFSHLPKKQQELFLRIQQHQKVAETNQDANVDNNNDKDNSKTDVNWYSSDEEEPEPIQESASPLATLLRTIQTSTSSSMCQVPNLLNNTNNIPPISNAAVPHSNLTESETLQLVDESQLVNIDLSDEIAKRLTSIISAVSIRTYNDTITANTYPITEMHTDNNSSVSIIPKPTTESESFDANKILLPLPVMHRSSKDDVDLRFPNVNLITSSLFSSGEQPAKDIDLRQLPFKPVPLHDAANEIDASITSHPPMEYRLKPLPFITKVQYMSMNDVSKVYPNDPRFKKKLITTSMVTVTNAFSVTATSSCSAINNAAGAINPASAINTAFPTAVTNALPESHLECMLVKGVPNERGDPRLVDPRTRLDPRLDNKCLKVTTVLTSVKSDPRIDKDQIRPTDFRDPRLTGRNKFPEVSQMPHQMAGVPAAISMPLAMVNLLPKETIPNRKEDPRLRFRAHQNA